MATSSRLIVKNLPNSITEEKLKKLFSEFGVITDIKLKYKDGKFRHFGFVGFSNPEEAQKARGHFDKTCIGASKVSVELCEELGSKKPAKEIYGKPKEVEEEKPEAKKSKDDKKARKAEKKAAKEARKERVKELFSKYKDDPKFEEFMRIHKRNVPVWNDEAILEAGKTFLDDKNGSSAEEGYESSNEDGKKEDKEEEEEEKVEAGDKKVSDLDYLMSKVVDEEKPKKEKKEKPKKEPKNEEYFTVKLSNLPVKAKKKDIKSFFAPLKAKSIRRPPKIDGIGYVGFATEADMKKALVKNKSFMKDKQVFVKVYSKGGNNSSKANEQRQQKWKEEAEKGESVGESGRLFLRNLSYTVKEEDIEELFKGYGALAEVNLPIDRVSRKPKGFAFVTFVIPENAVKAFTELDGTTLQGRLLHIIPGKAKPGEGDDDANEGSSYKKKKAAAEKASAGSSHNWNTLFLGASAVADLMAEKYGVGKSDVLVGDGGKQSAAVRLALGETEIVSETRRYLEEEGVSLEAVSSSGAGVSRSKTVILVKNLPPHTPLEEIRDKFAKFGELGRVVLPPRGITAVVEFLDPSEARKGFRGLAYTRFHNTPLYLEWAPENSFTKPAAAPSEKPKDEEEVKNETVKDEIATSLLEPEDNSTLFVKNLNFATNEDALKSFFEAVGKIHSVTVARKRDPKRPGHKLSMGYGFVQYYSAKDADKALKTLQRKMLDDHCLELKRSDRAGNANDTKANQNRNSSSGLTKAEDGENKASKILVRNVPFEATQKDLEEIFKTFGELKTVRLPKKIDGQHRGFCFVDFQTWSDAKRAFEALSLSTHLYGRRLVLEWAAKEETVEDLRRKTASHYDEPASKKLKKSNLMESFLLSKQ